MDFNLSLLFNISRIVYLGLVLAAMGFVWRNGFHNLALARFFNKYQDILKSQNIPLLQRYLESSSVGHIAEDKRLTNYANKLAKKVGIVDKSFVVFVSKEQDPNLTGKPIFVLNCVDKVFLLFDKEFVANNSRAVLKSLVCLNVGRCVNNDELVKKVVLSDSLLWKLLIFTSSALLIQSISLSWWFGVTIALFRSSDVFNFSYARWAQAKDFAADIFVLQHCGSKDAVLQMIDAELKADDTPQKPFLSRVWARIFGVAASYQQRINAINKLK